ncbi:MAG TPA: LLM class flavin-dependent oxidoreductase [Thermoanaerobaculia bacterium]|nr:LLM class flavin-dependent oxidoreductase [Thermoanaerobaculia bacterium]
MQLSVLDQSPISEGATGAEALRNSVDLARFAERLGYRRYWVAEHHATPMLASASPEVLIAAISAATTRLRVGSGGVMLPHYSPLKVAETFSMLGGLFGDRIDLAVGRAAGTDPLTTFALQRDRRQAAPDDFPQQLAELLAYLEDRMPPDHPFARLTLLPGRPGRPEPWLLGSSEQSAIWAAETGLPYAFADFINPGGAPFARAYRRDFAQDGYLPAPRVLVAVTAICAESDDEAWRLAASSRMVFSLLHRGQLLPVPPVETALAWFASEGLDARALPPGRRAIIGSPATVIAGLRAVEEEYEADELMIVTITFGHEARKRSYELIAEAALLSS